MTTDKYHLGQETEYAIRFSPRPGSTRPTNEKVYIAFAQAIKSFTKTMKGPSKGLYPALFVGNGGSIYYECPLLEPSQGLIEGQTPECSSASELVLYQCAQEQLLKKAIPEAQRLLADSGYPGELGLLKNCRDAYGNIYGAQENYDAHIAHGWRLGLWRLGVAFVVLWTLPIMTVIVGVSIILLLAGFWNELKAFARMPEDGSDAWDMMEADFNRRFMERYGARYFKVFSILLWPAVILSHAFAFRQVTKGIESFLMCRILLTGSGTLVDGDQFCLSEKAVDVRRMKHLWASDQEKVVVECNHLWKPLYVETAALSFGGRLKELFRGRRRFQLSLSDSNRAQVAEFLKLGATGLIVEMADRGFLKDAPRFKSPIAALKLFNRDGSLQDQAICRDGKMRSASDVLEWYLERAETYLREQKTVSMHHTEVVKVWRSVMETLRSNPGDLLGRLDWVTKKYLIDVAGQGLDKHALKKIDLRYHELGSGYFDWFVEREIAPQMFDQETIDRAMTQPPNTLPAKIRSRLIKSVAFAGARASVSWSEFRVERPEGGAEVIPFSKFFNKDRGA